MIQQGKKVFFLCSRDLTCTSLCVWCFVLVTPPVVCIRKSCTYIEDSMRDPRYRGHGVALRNKSAFLSIIKNGCSCCCAVVFSFLSFLP